MTIKEYLEAGDKRTKAYRDVKEYVEIIRHHHGPQKVEEVLKKQVVDVIGIEMPRQKQPRALDDSIRDAERRGSKARPGDVGGIINRESKEER